MDYPPNGRRDVPDDSREIDAPPKIEELLPFSKQSRSLRKIGCSNRSYQSPRHCVQSGWLAEILKTNCQLQLLLSQTVLKHYLFLFSSFSDLVQTALLQLAVENLPVALNQVIALFERALERLLCKEQARTGQAAAHQYVTDGVFLRSLLACAVLAVVFTQQSAGPVVQVVVSRLRIHALDLWRQLQPFACFHSQLPADFLAYLKQVEANILLCFGWQNESPLVHTSETTFPLFAKHLFVRRLLTLIAHRIDKLCTACSLTSFIRDTVFSIVKRFVTEHAEWLEVRSVDEIVLCATFAVCRVTELFPFLTLVQKYDELFDSGVTLSQGLSDFYNCTFILLVKEQLLGVDGLTDFHKSLQSIRSRIDQETTNRLALPGDTRRVLKFE